MSSLFSMIFLCTITLSLHPSDALKRYDSQAVLYVPRKIDSSARELVPEFGIRICKKSSFDGLHEDVDPIILSQVAYKDLLMLRRCNQKLRNAITFYRQSLEANLEINDCCMWWRKRMEDHYTQQAVDLIKKRRLIIAEAQSDNNLHQGKNIFLDAWFSQSPPVVAIDKGFVEKRGDVAAIINRMPFSNTLKYFAILGNIMSEQDQKALAIVLQKSPQLEVLEVKSSPSRKDYSCEKQKSFVSDSAVEAISNILPSHHYIKSLRLAGGSITNRGATFLVQGLEGNKSLEEIILNNNKIGKQGLEILKEACNKHPCLQQLSMMHNKAHNSKFSIREYFTKSNF